MSHNKNPILNHIISFANSRNIDDYLKRYKRAGFAISKSTVRHEPGLRNGFIYFGPEYIEFEWVEDKKLFKHGAKQYEIFFQNNPSPFGVAFESQDVSALHSEWKRRGFKVSRIWSKGPRGADKSIIWWSFQDIPQKYLPGVWSFALSYKFRKKQGGIRKVFMGKNTLFAISGMTMVSKNPGQRAGLWKNFLAPRSTIRMINTNRYQFDIGPHVFEWVTPKEYKSLYGLRKKLTGRFKHFQEVALIHLLAKELTTAERFLKRGGLKLNKRGGNLLILPKKSDGFTFLIRQGKVSDWLYLRQKFGQKLSFVAQ